MRCLIFPVLFLIFSCGESRRSNDFSENVIAVYNIDSVFAQLPEFNSIYDTLQKLKDKLDMKDAVMTRTYWALQDHFYEDSLKWDEAKKKSKQNEIDTLFKHIDYCRTSAWNELNKLKCAAMDPLYKKVNTIINAVARKNGYVAVINCNEDISTLSWASTKMRIINITGDLSWEVKK